MRIVASELKEAIMRLGVSSAGPSARSSTASSCLALLLVSCAVPRTEPTIAAPPEQLSMLQRAYARDTSNMATRLRLADARRRAGQPDSAARLLEPVAASTPLASFYLGLVREDQGRASDARQLYERFLAQRGNDELRDRVRDRLTLLGRLELQQAVRASLERERELSTRPTEPRVLGVFPFLTATADTALHPLGTAFAELLSNDLAQTQRLRIVERARVQQLLNEIRLSESRRVDSATAVRSGRLLGAGTLVQGRIEGNSTQANFQAAVVRVQPQPGANAPLSERQALARLFDVEKRLALGIYSRMGIQLTTAERDRVTHQATRNVQALLELGYGLEAQDAGRYAEAATHFARAAQLDPNFALAKQKASEAAVQARAVAVSTSTLAQLALVGLPVPPVVPTAPDVPVGRRFDRFAAVERLVPNPTVRDASVEALGVEGLSRTAPADIVIRRP